MTRAEFDAWSPHSVANFAAQQVAPGQHFLRVEEVVEAGPSGTCSAKIRAASRRASSAG